MKPTLATALDLRAMGISTIPVRANKVPRIKEWAQYMTQLPTEDELQEFYKNGANISIVAGKVQCIDVDEKYESGLMDRFKALAIKAGLGDIWNSCLIQRTPSGGYHIIFQTECEPFRNMKLASKSAEEGYDVLIETRGAGGYFLIAPSEGYEVIQGDFNFLPILTEEEREDLLDVARSFNRNFKDEQATPNPVNDAGLKAKNSVEQTTPGDEFDQRGDIEGLLQSHGWKKVDPVHWCRPGKSRGISASLGHIPGRFYVFSTSTQFEPEKPYKPYAVYAMLEHGGDFKSAMSELARQGYGTPLNKKTNKILSPKESLQEALENQEIEERQQQEESLLQRLSKVEFWPGPEPEDERCLFKLAGIEIAHVGNHVTLIAPVKSGKSAFIGAVLAATTPTAEGADLLGLEFTNRENHAVIHIDTEQSRNDHHRLLTRSLWRCGVQNPPDHLLSFCMTGWEPSEIIQSIEFLAEKAKAAFGGIHSIIVDGIADLITSPNDEEAANGLERWFRNITIQYQCCGVGVIHQNPGSDKSRGHLGSQFERKSETVLMMEKVNERTVIYSTRTRRAPILKENAPAFRWSDEKKAHVSCKTKPKTIEPKGPKARAKEKAERMTRAKEWLMGEAMVSALTISSIHDTLESHFELSREQDRRNVIGFVQDTGSELERVKARKGKIDVWILGSSKKAHELKHKIETEYQQNQQATTDEIN